MATIKDIAAKLGVSSGTVSKGLNGGNDISEELRQQILDTAVEMGYATKQSRKISNRKLCVMIENMDYKSPDDFGYEIVLGFRQIALKEKWNVDIIEVSKIMEADEKYDNYLLRNRYSGAFLLGFAFDDKWTQELANSKMPTVLLDNSISYNFHVCEVGTDSMEGISLAVDHLYQLGHTNIAFLNGSAGSKITDDRQNAFEEAMKRHNLKIRPELCGNGYYITDTDVSFVSDFLKNGATAILCGNDLMAAGVMRECHKLGYRIPEDISIIGYDDIRLAEELDPQLTTVRQERNMLGRQAYMDLYSLIHNIPVARTVLRPRLVIRHSTGPAPILTDEKDLM